MKQLITLIILLAPFCLQAQKVLEESWTLEAGKSVSLKLDHAREIQLRGWDKPQVQVKATILVNGGRHNDAVSLSATQEGGDLQLVSRLDESQITTYAPEDCEGQQFYWQRNSDNKQRSICLDVVYEVWVPKNAPVALKTISGNVVATNLSGALDMHSISGFIDLSWPAVQAADLMLKSVTGELYTNLDLQILNKKDEIPIVGYEMKGQLGNGGTKVRLETISSNIYLRKE